MALANYSDLVTAINGWLSRSDMTTIAPDLIALAEAEFNRTLRTIDMEAISTSTLVGDALSLPADFAGLRSLSMDNTEIEQTTPQQLFNTTETSGNPVHFAITDGQFFFRPAPTSSTITIAYYQRIPALTAIDPTNWLMTKHPDLYLFASLAQAEFYNWNDDRLPIIKARTEELIEQINQATIKERFGARRLIMKPSTMPTIGVVRA